MAIFGKHEVFPMSDLENLLVDTNAFTQINLNRTKRLYKTLGWGEVNIIDMDLRLVKGTKEGKLGWSVDKNYLMKIVGKVKR
jgi:hypothetical protein